MALRFTYEVAGDVQLDRALSRYGDALKDLRPAFQEIAESFKQIEAKQFASEGGVGSVGWAPLSANYALWKGMHYPGKKILELSGALLASVTGAGPGYIEEIKKDSLKLGTKLPWSYWHQKATGRMPARPVIQLTEANKREWMKIIQRRAYAAAKEVGLA